MKHLNNWCFLISLGANLKMQYQKFVKEFWGLINMFLELRFPLLLTGLRETKIKVDQQPLINIDLPGYSFNAGPESTPLVPGQKIWLTKGHHEGERVLGKCLVCQWQRIGWCSQKMEQLMSGGGVGVASFPAFTHVRINFVGVPP